MRKGLGKVWLSCIEFISILVHPLYKLLGKKRIPILLYHRVCNNPEGTVNSGVNTAAFAQQMEFLSQNGFNIITLDELIDYKDENRKFPPKSVIITFDDGYMEHYANAFPILEKYGFKGTFFIITDYIDSEAFLSKQNILDMSSRGASFGSHSKSHRPLIDIEQDEAIEELEGSKQRLEEMLSKPVRCFSYPYGKMDESIKGMVKAAGYKTAVAGTGTNTLRSNFLQLGRIELSEQDSLAKFGRKVDGAYDWLKYLQPGFKFIRRILS